MPIPLGIFATAGAGGGAAAGSYELISTAYGTGSSATITFSSIPAEYKHLQIRTASRNLGGTVAGASSILTRFNGDSTAGSYRHHNLRGTGSAVASGDGGPSRNSIEILRTTVTNGSPASITGAAIIDILDYSSTTKYKTVCALSGSLSTGTEQITLNSGVWFKTNAIDQITLQDIGGNYTTNSRFSLYGIK